MLLRFRGSLLAGACGDALGYPIEFYRYSSIVSKFGEGGLKDMILVDGKAEISDDTQMDIYTAQGLIHAHEKHCDYNDTIIEIHKSYYRWYNGQENGLSYQMKKLYSVNEIENDDLIVDATHSALTANRAPGCTCLSALSSGKMGTTTTSLNDSKGCGGIMRIGCIPICYWNNPELAYQYAVDASALTHSHILGYTSSGALAMIISYIYQGKSLCDSIQLTLEYLRTDSSNDFLIQVIENAVNTADNGLVGKEAFSILGEGWVAEETLAIGLWAALMYPTDLKKALLASVNHSGDSDSTGCVCGYIMGAMLGEDAIPSEWLKNLELRDLIIEQAEKLACF